MQVDNLRSDADVCSDAAHIEKRPASRPGCGRSSNTWAAHARPRTQTRPALARLRLCATGTHKRPMLLQRSQGSGVPCRSPLPCGARECPRWTFGAAVWPPRFAQCPLSTAFANHERGSCQRDAGLLHGAHSGRRRTKRPAKPPRSAALAARCSSNSAGVIPCSAARAWTTSRRSESSAGSPLAMYSPASS